LINFFKNIWRRLFGVKTGSYETFMIQEYWHRQPDGSKKTWIKIGDGEFQRTYDPSEDEHKKMNGEVESYFD
jgi:hypothetical protein